MNDIAATHCLDEPTRYVIRVGGHLADRWSQHLDDLTLTRQPDGTTVLTGQMTDQAALHGLLQKVRDLGLPLLAVTRVPDDSAAEPVDPTAPTTSTATSTTTTRSPS